MCHFVRIRDVPLCDEQDYNHHKAARPVIADKVARPHTLERLINETKVCRYKKKD